MPQSLAFNYIHVTFSSKNREYHIKNDIKDELFNYLGGICKQLECNPLCVGGHKDHVHVLCLLSKKITLIKLLEEIKKGSSKWIKTKGHAYRNFYWQQGYGAFSVSPVQTDVVVKYIKNQEEHHRKITFQEEYRAFLRKYKVVFDERYVWD